MFEAQLFLGFKVNEDFQKSLENVNPALIKLFIQEDEHYLNKIIHDGSFFLGKFLGKNTDMNILILLETNIYSLLKKIVPEYPYPDFPLYLFPHLEMTSPHG